MLFVDGKVWEQLEVFDNDDITPLTKSQIDAELAKVRSMTAKEAAANGLSNCCRGRG